MIRVNKTAGRRIKDFENRVIILNDALQQFHNGNYAYYIPILATLRTLICDGKGNQLLQEISQITGIPALIHTSFLGQKSLINLDKYLLSNGPIRNENGDWYTLKGYIYALASQEGSHSDPSMDKALVNAELLYLGGISANKLQVVKTAEVVLMACQEQLKEIEGKN